MESSRRLGLLRQSPPFGYLFLATAGSAIGTYLAAIALTVDVYERTDKSGVWVAGLLIVNFLPIVLIGLLFGPLVDRLSRRRLMIVSDLVRFGAFAALPILDQTGLDSAGAVVACAAVAGVATGFFLPAVYAGLPNLVSDEELVEANALLQTIETLAWMIGPILGGLMVNAWSPSVPYGINAVTFLVSAVLVARIPARMLKSEEPLTRGHWRDVADGLALVVRTRALRTVLVVWTVAMVGAGAINVAEIFFATETLDAGSPGFGLLLAASGVGLVIGSFLSAPSLGQVGLRRHYVVAIVLMGVGWGGAALIPRLWEPPFPPILIAVPMVIAGAAGNGAAIIANRLFVQRGAPDRYRGRALATIISTNYAVMGLSMAGTGLLLKVVSPSWIWISAGGIYLAAAFIAFVMTRWLPVTRVEEAEAIEASAAAAVAVLGQADVFVGQPEPQLHPQPVLEREPEPPPEVPPEPERRPEPEPVPAPAPAPAANGAAPSALERIATLLEEIEERRALEGKRPSR